MPVVFVPGKGNIQFPDNMTPYQITLAIEREIIPNRRPETISAPKRPEGGIWNAIKGIGAEIAAIPAELRATVQDISAGDIIEGVARLNPLGAPAAGIGKAVDDFLPSFGPSREEMARREKIYGEAATRTREKQAAREARAAANAAAPDFESPLARMGYSAASSLVQMSPGLIGSVATGSPIPALANVGAITFPEAYQRYDERGATPQEALTGAVAETGIELGTEMLPLGAVVNKLGKVGFGKFLREFLGRELIGEEIATITQNAVDTAIANPDKTWGDYVSELPMQMVETAGATLLTGGALAGAGAIAKRVTGAQEPTEEAPAAKRAAAPPPPPPPPADFAQKLGAVGSKIILNEPGGVNEYTYRGMDEDGRVIIEAEDGSIFAEDPAEINAAIDVGAVVPTEPDETPLPGVAFGEEEVEPAPAVAPEPEPAPVTVPEPEGKPLSRFIAEFEEPAGKPISQFTAEPELADVFAEPETAPAPSKPEGKFTVTLPPAAEAPTPSAPSPSNTQKQSSVGNVNFDQVSGIGSVPYNQNVNYMGFTAMMKPSKFLELAADLDEPKQKSIDYIRKSIGEGKAVGSPFLQLDFKNGKVKGHDGRHRMMVIQEMNGDQPVPVHFFGTGEQRARLLDEGKISTLRSSITGEGGNVSSDNFSEAFLQGKVVPPAPTESIAPPEQMPIDEDVGPYMQEYATLRTADQMRQIEDNARKIAAARGAQSVSKEDMLQSATEIDDARFKTPAGPKKKFEIQPLPPEPAAAPRAVGKKATVTIPATRNKVEVQDELLDLADVKFAEGELQNRDRSRPQTQQFLRRFTSEFDPEGLGEDRSTDRGAPIINKDNVILSGNGRTMGLEEIYEKYPEQAEKYRQFLRDNGWDIEGIERPFLARRLLSDVDEREFVTGSNEADIAALSPPEQAAQDAQDILKPAVMAKYNGGDLNASKNDAFISAFLAEMSPQQRENAMDDKGNVSAQALKRIENALLYKAYGQAGRASDVFISKAMERSDDDTKTLTNALVEVANDWIKFQQAIKAGEVDKKYDITGKLMEAVATVSDIKSSGNSVSGALRSEDMITPMDPFVKEILAAFHNDKLTRMLSKKAIAEKLQDYTDIAANQQAAPDMFGKAETPSAREVWKRIENTEQDLFRSIEPMPPERQQEVIDEARRVPSLSRGVAKIVKKWDKGLLSDAEFAQWVADLSDYIAEMKDAKRFKDAQKGRARGADRIIEVMYRAKRQGILSEEAVDFMLWALKGNPNLANNLAISILAPKAGSPGGNYDPSRRLMRLFKGQGADTTAVHEMLHHTERMMPEDAQQAIRAAWLKALNKTAKKDEKNPRSQTFFKAIRAMHSGQNFTIAGQSYPSNKGWDIALNLMELGHVPYSYYQYVNPSEFWAVNATDIMQKRFGVKDSTLGRMSNWLLELAEKAKGLFNLSTKSPLIKALDSLAKADGKFNSLNMLQEEGARYMDVSSLTDERNRRVLERAEQLERQDMKASVSALDEVIDDLNLVYESLPKDSPERANVDALEERLSNLLSRIESARRPSNENVPETELERAQREYEAAHKQFMDLFYNPDDERQFMDRRTRARKEYEKELDQLEKADREARDKWEKLYQKETERLSELMLKGSPADMKKAIAKAQEPDNKIMDERADIQKKNRGCD
jgi:hypothetical protein